MKTNTTPGPPSAANACRKPVEPGRSRKLRSQFGRFRVLVRELLLVADDVSIKLRTPGFDLFFCRVATDCWHQDDLFSRAWLGILSPKRT